MRIAAYRQYNKMIPSTVECCSTGKMKRDYGIKGILRMIGPDKNASLSNIEFRMYQTERAGDMDSIPRYIEYLVAESRPV